MAYQERIQYFVNEQMGTVVAVLENIHNEIYDEINRVMTKNCGRGILADLYKYIPKCPDVYRGIARCSMDDTFDEELGKKLAKARLLEKVASAKQKAFQEVSDMVLNVMYALDEKADMYEERIDDYYFDSRDLLDQNS